ncbi:MAG TPA: hypothetical protein VEZ47_11715 [Gemmatirosa sp.]|jgi:hypothetical protein|nr:hypothetical protein [Gemmatirosa sp.]
MSHPAVRRSARVSLVALFAGLVLFGPACAGRVVEVGAGPEASGSDATLVVTNSLAQAVNVYVRPAGGSEIFLRQIAGNVTETIPVRGLGVGTSVSLRAAPVDGRLSYSRENVVLARGVTWRVP